MSEDETTYVLIGGYLSAEAAHEDYEAVLGCGARLMGAVVVSKDLEGNVSLEQSDHTVGRQPSGSAVWGLSSGCSHLHYWLRRRSEQLSAPSVARRCTRRSAAKSRRWLSGPSPSAGRV